MKRKRSAACLSPGNVAAASAHSGKTGGDSDEEAGLSEDDAADSGDDCNLRQQHIASFKCCGLVVAR